MKKDTLFTDLAESHSFHFDKSVAEVFDDMILRSVPGYLTQQNFMSENICNCIEANNNMNQVSAILDLGCSTGATIEYITHRAQKKSIPLHQSTMLGCDYSADMLEICQSKIQTIQQFWSGVELFQIDLVNGEEFWKELGTRYERNSIDIIILHFVLQFLPLEKRHEILCRCWELIQAGGFLFIGEKVYNDNPTIQTMWEQMQYTFKLEQGYTKMQIESKKRALEGVLIAQEAQALQDMLISLPNSIVAPYYTHGEFQCYVVQKEA